MIPIHVLFSEIFKYIRDAPNIRSRDPAISVWVTSLSPDYLSTTIPKSKKIKRIDKSQMWIMPHFTKSAIPFLDRVARLSLRDQSIMKTDSILNLAGFRPPLSRHIVIIRKIKQKKKTMQNILEKVLKFGRSKQLAESI